ncbi:MULTISPECIES: methyl-accepting chemotaxis protein [unclassified Leptolyngbya]|uniref:methyl-accepting chemotaxis protein n=1 Tax=unclassified Leptolyngbya TaxID=2650499 RepID=UPI001685E57A|nr:MULTISPECIES: methyl-accepting chemotaxis protein [unclassified Leptolyngbya]MBD1911461.1 CHASE3 domain-containing protein [Leptolyngbya sp. FACHB-8]MBD2153473.1 CHASE3 domain-containing protein [Leptolyngbya sp. FACHB-16]
MNQTTRWKLRHWIVVGYSIPVVALCISAGVVIRSVNTLNHLSEEYSTSRNIVEAINKVSLDVQISSRAIRGYLLDKDPVSLDSVNKAEADLKEDIALLSSMLRDSQQKTSLAELQPQLVRLGATRQNLVNLVNQNKANEAINVWRNDKGREQVDIVTTLIDGMRAREQELVEEDNHNQTEALNNLKSTLLLATTASILVSLGLGSWIINRTSNQMTESASTIAASTTEIAATIEQQERTANQQAVSVSETTTTMDELGASSRQSAQQAEAAAAGAKQALVLASGGTVAVDRTIHGMSDLKRKVEAIADQILRLSEQTSQIGSISGLVSDLANQTNMLALNAAVEAVRAGEHGKGFAVVATEIRKLADQSRKSAEKINTLVSDIQTAINSTVMVTDEGTKTVDEGVRIAQDTANSFSGVADAVNNVVLNSQQISLNIQQQSIAIQQVVDAMNALNAAARENVNGIGQIRSGTQRLNDAAKGLKAIV